VKARNYIAVTVCILLCLTACPSNPSVQTTPVTQTDSSSETSTAASASENAQTLTEALEKSGRIISESLDAGVSVAIISITAPDLFEGEYALEELTIQLVNARKFRVVDRHNLDVIRAEQRFQLSGEVDDDTAVSIGHLIGAAYVITGGISPWGQANYLRLRVIDVETGQIKTMTSVSYGGNL
jgi:curli biogenesis system outer membrane secretion channel CsgG